MPKTKAEKDAEREAAHAALKALIDSGTLAGDIAEAFAGEFDTMAPGRLASMAIIAAQVAEATLDGISMIEAADAHIGVQNIEYANGTVQLDAAGNLVSAEFEGRVILL